jgi:hypothetical protein
VRCGSIRSGLPKGCFIRGWCEAISFEAMQAGAALGEFGIEYPDGLTVLMLKFLHWEIVCCFVVARDGLSAASRDSTDCLVGRRTTIFATY